MAEQVEEKKEELTVAITGANRGLGLEFVTQYLAKGYSVIAFCRTPEKAKELNELKEKNKDKLCIYALDATNDEQIKNLVTTIGGKDKAIDILILNAGIWGDDITRDELIKVFSINCAGPLLIGKELYDNVKISKRKQMIVISSGLGSVSTISNTYKYFPAMPYRISKAALQMAWQYFDQTSKANNDGIKATIIAPGWVQTDLHPSNKGSAPQTPQDSIKDMINNVIEKDDLKGGGFYNYDGKEIQW